MKTKTNNSMARRVALTKKAHLAKQKQSAKLNIKAKAKAKIATSLKSLKTMSTNAAQKAVKATRKRPTANKVRRVS